MMHFQTKFCLFFFFNTWLSVFYPEIILVHGSFAQQASWYRPKGNFYQALKQKASLCHQRLTSFSWNGFPNQTHIKKAADNLCAYLLALTDTMPTMLIGHSHGGNVIISASQLLYKHYQEIIQTFSFNEEHLIVTNIPTPQDHFDLTNTPRNFLMSQGKTCIQTVVLLGTPVNTTHYWPHMEIINQLFLFYSLGDLVQTVAGNYERYYPPHPRIINLNILFSTKQKHAIESHYAPTHSELHHPCIGKELLTIIEEPYESTITYTKIFTV